MQNKDALMEFDDEDHDQSTGQTSSKKDIK